MGVETRVKRVQQLMQANARSGDLSLPHVDLISFAEPLSRNRQHITELYDHLRPSLQAYLSLRGLSKDHSEDVIQEAFLRLVRHIVNRGPDANSRGWVFRVAHNLSMDFHRLEKRHTRPSDAEAQPAVTERTDPAPNPEQSIILRERRRHLREAVAQLTPKQRHCLLLRAKGLRYREIARLMGVSVQRVSELMQRAISLIEMGVASR